MGPYDIIIIGDGPNGLVAGTYLAKAGQKSWFWSAALRWVVA